MCRICQQDDRQNDCPAHICQPLLSPLSLYRQKVGPLADGDHFTVSTMSVFENDVEAE